MGLVIHHARHPDTGPSGHSHEGNALRSARAFCPPPPTRTCAPRLRRLIRKYYAKTRDGQGNVEEALRFINHASRILSDPERRARYDEELALSTGTTEQRIAHVVSNAVAEAGEQTDVGTRGSRPHRKSQDYRWTTSSRPALDADEPRVERNPHHPGLTERVASFGRSPIVTLGLCALFGAFIAAAIVFVTPADAMLVAKQVLVWLTLALLGLTIIYGVVHGVAYVRRRRDDAAGRPRCRRPTSRSSTGAARRACSSAPTSRRRTRAGSSSCAWRSSSARSRAARASRGRGSAWARASSTTRSGGSCSRCCCPSCAGSASCPTRRRVLARRIRWSRRSIITATWVPIEALLIAVARHHAGQVAVRRLPAVLDLRCLRAARHARAARARVSPRVPRVVGRHGLRLPAARAGLDRGRLREARAEPGDRLGLRARTASSTHGPPGVLNSPTGVLRSRRDAVALWRRVARADGRIDRLGARTSIAHAIPVSSPLPGATGSGKIGVAGRPVTSAQAMPQAVAPPATAVPSTSGAPTNTGIPGAQGGIDPEVDAILARHRARIEALKAEGPRMLRAGNWRRAAELCREWTDLDLANAEAWRCLGDAQQALGNYKDALAAYRRAKQYDPNDRAHRRVRSNARSAASSPSSSRGIGADHPSLLGRRATGAVSRPSVFRRPRHGPRHSAPVP